MDKTQHYTNPKLSTQPTKSSYTIFVLCILNVLVIKSFLGVK